MDLTKDGSGSTFTISYKKMFQSESLKYKGDVSPEPNWELAPWERSLTVEDHTSQSTSGNEP